MKEKNRTSVLLEKPEYNPETPEIENKFQQANKSFWEAHPMRYDWKEELNYKEHSLDFYKEIDHRFFASVKEFMPWKKEPFDNLIPFEELKNYDVLEIGVGNGSHAQLLTTYAKSFTGIDLTEYATRSVNERLKVFGLNGLVINTDAEKMPFPDASFDFVWSWGVIHHSSNTSKIIDEIKRVLKPHGKVTVMVYYRGWWNYYVIGTVFHGIILGKFFKLGSLHKIIQTTTDGALARFYTKKSWKKMIDGRLKINATRITGMKSELFPIPGGRIKKTLMAIFPNRVTRLFTNSFKMGGFVISEMQNEK